MQLLFIQLHRNINPQMTVFGLCHYYIQYAESTTECQSSGPYVTGSNTENDKFTVCYTLITNLMHWLLFIRKILLSSTCFEHQVLIFRRT